MKTIKLSIYFYLFNATIREFDLDGTIKNFTDFADEVVCATIPSQDDTYERLQRWQETLGPEKFKVVMTDIKLSNNRFDGDLKTAALLACSRNEDNVDRFYIIADADERFVLSNKPNWIRAANELLSYKHIKGMNLSGWLIPVIDLYKDEQHIMSDKFIGNKFRMHDGTVVKRGVIPEAEIGDGLFNTEKSDSTEPLNLLGELANFHPIVQNPNFMHPSLCQYLTDYPYVLHYGHMDINRRIKINKEFWKQHWENRSGREETNMALSTEEFDKIRPVKHNLPII